MVHKSINNGIKSLNKKIALFRFYCVISYIITVNFCYSYKYKYFI